MQLLPYQPTNLLTEGGGSAKVRQHSFGNDFLIYAAWR